jgi:hypothetical protein
MLARRRSRELGREIRTRNGKTLCFEQGLDLLNRESLKRPLDNFSCGQGLLFLSLLLISTDLVQDLFGEPGGSPVLVGDSVNSSHGLVLTTAGHQELRGFVERKEEESTKEHGKGNGAQRQNKIPPAPVVCLGTGVIAFTRESRNESPGEHTDRELAR